MKTKRKAKSSTRIPKPAGKDVTVLKVVPGSKPRITDTLLARARIKPKTREQQQDEIRRIFRPYEPPPGVLPAGAKVSQSKMAMDSSAVADWSANAISAGIYWSEGLTFPGYAYLSELTVRPEYRVISQVIATEMTRKWITFHATDDAKTSPDGEGEEDGVLEASGVLPEEQKAGEGEEADEPDDEQDEDAPPDGTAKDAAPPAPPGQGPGMSEEVMLQMQEAKEEKDQLRNEQSKARAEALAGDDGKADRIKELTKEFDRLCVRDIFAKLAEFDGYFGRVHLYIDTGQGDDPAELLTDLGTGSDEVTKQKFKKGSLERLQVVEPLWTYPQSYNSNDPLVPEWYNPSIWFVMAKQLHCSRLLTFVGRPVPDVLKPAYAFGGLSLSQMAKPYIDNWLNTRQSVNDIIRAFSVMVISTDMSSTLSADGDGLFKRIDLFNMLRDNRGCFVVDKETEDFKNVSAPLSSLDSLQAQAQEHMAAITRIPLIKLLGISPQGLNASSEGELRAFYDTIASFQESFFRPNLTKIMHFAMMNLWGEVDEDITFTFEPLEELNMKEQAEVRKIEAETYDILVNGVAAVHPEEVRKVIASDPESHFQGIDVADVPDAPVDEGALGLSGHKPFSEGAQAGEIEQGAPGAPEEKDESAGPFKRKGSPISSAPMFGEDEWKESDHPRVKGGENAGQFGSGGGSSAGGESKERREPYVFKSNEHFEVRNVTPREGDAVKEWVENYEVFEEINFNLRKGRESGLDDEEADLVRTLSKAIEKSTLKEPMTLSRGFSTGEDNFGHNPGQKLLDKLNAMKVGDVYTDRGFTATSTGSAATDYGPEGTGSGAMMKIEAPAGTQALELFDQGEVLLQKGTKFQLTGVKDVKGFPEFSFKIVKDN